MNDQWSTLANAVVLQAALDWLGANKYIELNEGSNRIRIRYLVNTARKVKQDSEEFFLSERFGCFTDLDGHYVLRSLKEEAARRKDDSYGFGFMIGL